MKIVSDKDGVFELPVSALQDLGLDPFESTPWNELEYPLSKSWVARAIERNPDCSSKWPYDGEQSREWHVNRVACLAISGWDGQPIRIGESEMDSVEIDDGNHRLAAAIFNGDQFIRSLLYSRKIREIFGAEYHPERNRKKRSGRVVRKKMGNHQIDEVLEVT